jgi:hypothetical protein
MWHPDEGGGTPDKGGTYDLGTTPSSRPPAGVGLPGLVMGAGRLLRRRSARTEDVTHQRVGFGRGQPV